MPPQHPATPPQAAPLHRLSRPLYAGDPGNSVCADQVGDSVRAMKAPSADQVGDSVLIAQPSRVSGRHVPRASLVVTSLARLWSSRPRQDTLFRIFSLSRASLVVTSPLAAGCGMRRGCSRRWWPGSPPPGPPRRCSTGAAPPRTAVAWGSDRRRSISDLSREFSAATVSVRTQQAAEVLAVGLGQAAS